MKSKIITTLSMKLKFSPLTKKQRLLLSALILFLLSSTISLAYFSRAHSLLISPQTSANILSSQQTIPALPETPEDLKSLGILLLGYGGPGHEGGALTDVIILAYFDFNQSTLSLISLPRDLWVNFPNGTNHKINSAYSQSPDIAKATATTVTGLPVNYFIAIDFAGFERAIGYGLKGIDVKVEAELDDPWYPIKGLELEPCDHTPEEISELSAQYSGFELEKQFPCRYEHLHFDAGTVHMEGGDVLKFVRSRHSSSDFARSQRQQAVLLAIKDKLLSLKAPDNALKFFRELNQYVHTDIDENLVNYLTPLLKTIINFQVIHLNLSTENVLTESTANSAFILIPQAGFNNWSSIHNYINQQSAKP
jgi:LCP family protein required for cell wall assembly